MIECPRCRAVALDPATGRCGACGAVYGVSDDAPTQLVVDGPGPGAAPRPKNRRAHLVVVLGRTRVKEYHYDRGTISIGRDGIQDVVLDNPSVSRRHCQICYVAEQAGFLVQDLGSENGILLNGRRTAEAELASGDEIGVGKFSVLFNPTPQQLSGLEVRPGAPAAPSTEEDASTTYLSEMELDRVREELAVERGAHLRIVAGRPGAGERFALDQRNTVLGRSSDADVPLRGWLIARRHAVIERTVAGNYRLVHVGGWRVVRVNGAPVRERVLQDHDRIAIGNNVFQFFPAIR
jgi:pSer/pThr/pTyr-binding forkhead associated (FHA) protein